jgi:glutaminyl-tRNA synthetase
MDGSGTGFSICLLLVFLIRTNIWIYGFSPLPPNPMEEGTDFTQYLNEKSLEILKQCRVEPSLANSAPGSRFQLARIGYFCVDPVDSSDKALVFNRTITLRDSWTKISEKEKLMR